MSAVLKGLGGGLGEVPPDLQLDAGPLDITIEHTSPEDQPDIDERGNILKITHGDGSVSVSMDGNPLGRVKAANTGPREWFDNLVEDIEQTELSRIAEDLLLGVADDIASRKDWIEERATGIKLLGLKVEIPGTQGATDGAPVEGMSKVRHPLLLEAVLRFQANARSELLPTDGPVKIRNDSNDDTLKNDQLANAYEQDMNHYLTAVASEYYPDTDRMLLLLGFGGTTFKKVYKCPIRNRPVSETVDATDLIVNQAATDLANARRITHRTYLRPSTVKRLQILGVYRDIDLPDPGPEELDSLQKEKKDQQGLTPEGYRPDDRDREIYEIRCELNIKGYEHKWKDKETGLEIPYVVTIDKTSREVLAVCRNYNEDDQKLPTARRTFVKYTFVPGFGFYDIGLLHILGNTTNAVTAAWREMLDNGMFANFPGCVIAKGATRQNTNIMRIPPGGAFPMDTGDAPIRDVIMPLPYNTANMPSLMSLVENMVETGQRVGGTAELQVGEGRETQPVGTTMALIDQAIKIMSSVHKRMHASQAEEFQLLVAVFREYPETFFQKKCKSQTKWDVDRFIQAVNSCELVPQADPNTASMGHRAMKITALVQLQQMAQNLYDPIAVHTAALQAIGWAHPEQFFVPKQAQQQPPPQLRQLEGEIQNDQAVAGAKVKEADARATEAQAKLAETKAKIAVGHFNPKQEKGGVAGAPPPEEMTPLDLAEAEAKVRDSETRAGDLKLKQAQMRVEDVNRDQDRAAKVHGETMSLARDILLHPQGVNNLGKKVEKVEKATTPKK